MTIEQIQALSDDEIREMVGIILGWDCDPVEARDWVSRGQWAVRPGDAARGLTSKRMGLPNYPADLNACADMERSHINATNEARYGNFLALRCGEWKYHRASARARCEAFIAVMQPETT